MLGRRDHRGDRDRPGPRAAADLVDADDDLVARLPELPLEPQRGPQLRVGAEATWRGRTLGGRAGTAARTYPSGSSRPAITSTSSGSTAVANQASSISRGHLGAGEPQAHHQHVGVVPACARPPRWRRRCTARRARPAPCWPRSTRRCRSSRTARRCRARPSATASPTARPTSTHSPVVDRDRRAWPARLEVGAHRVGERGVLVGAERDVHRRANSMRCTSSSVANGMYATPNARAPRGERVLGEHDVGEQRGLAVAGAVADQHRGLPAVPRVLDRRLLARAARRARAAAVLVREQQLARS